MLYSVSMYENFWKPQETVNWFQKIAIVLMGYLGGECSFYFSTSKNIDLAP